MPLVPGVISTGRLSALVAYAIVPWFVHLLRTAAGIGTADPSAEAIDLVDGVLDLRPRERVRRTAVLALATAVAVALAPAVLPVLVVVAVVLGVTTLAVNAGVRTAAWLAGSGSWRARPRSCSTCRGRRRGRGTTSWRPSLAGAPGPRPRRRGVDGDRPQPLRGARARALRPGPRRPARRPGVAPDVGRPCRRPRRRVPAAGDPAGPRRAAVPGPRGRRPAGARRARPGDLRGRVRRRVRRGRRRAHVRVAPAARPRSAIAAVVRRRRAGAVRRHRRRVVRAALDADRGRRGAAAGRHRARGRRQPAGRRLPRAVPRRPPADPVPVARTSATAWRWRSSTTAPPTSATAGRSPTSRPTTPCARSSRQIATTGTRRAGRLLAPFGIRSIVVPVVDGATSTATAPLPIPDGLIDALGAQLDLARGRTPPTLIRFDNTAYIPTTASLTGALAAASTATDAEAVVGVDTSAASPVFVDVDRDTRRGRRRPGRAPSTSATPLDGGWELTVGGADGRGAAVVRRGDRVRRRRRRDPACCASPSRRRARCG